MKLKLNPRSIGRRFLQATLVAGSLSGILTVSAASTPIAAPQRGALSGPTPLNVVSFGARGDGTHDDTAPIQAALNRARPRQAVVVPGPNTYLVGRLMIPSGALFEGAGPAFPTLKLRPASNSALLQFANVPHVRTQIGGMVFDGNASAQVLTPDTAVVDMRGGPNGSLNNVLLENCVILNAAVHGVAISESTGHWTDYPKTVRNCEVRSHGVLGTGFGLYADYARGTVFDHNRVYSQNGNDNIELGHLGHMVASDNFVSGGQINFPFSDYSRIINNHVVGATIQNDNHAATGVLIQGNVVERANPSQGYAGITVTGTNHHVTNNHVEVVSGDGIEGTSEIFSGSVIEGNTVSTLASTNTGKGIGTGGSVLSTGNLMSGNTVSGRFRYGIVIVAPSQNVRYNVISLTGADAGIAVMASSMVGFVTGTNSTLVGNVVTGCGSFLLLPTSGNAPVDGLTVI